MYTVNNRGPRLEPYGTPIGTMALYDWLLLEALTWHRLERYDSNHLRAVESFKTLRLFSFDNERDSLTISNAFLSKVNEIRRVNCVVVVTVDALSRNRTAYQRAGGHYTDRRTFDYAPPSPKFYSLHGGQNRSWSVIGWVLLITLLEKWSHFCQFPDSMERLDSDVRDGATTSTNHSSFFFCWAYFNFRINWLWIHRLVFFALSVAVRIVFLVRFFKHSFGTI